MIIEGNYLDEILRDLYNSLSSSAVTFSASKGPGKDLIAPTINLKNPLSRISATANRGRLRSALGEFCWYMSGSEKIDFIRYYITDYPEIEGAYGPRLIGTKEPDYTINQIERAIKRLQRKPDTRRAAISILESGDLEDGKGEVPCTVALQFIYRCDRLHMATVMRSNDAYLGFPHDVFCFTMIQELVARSLGVEMGEYHHFATSLHLYDHNEANISVYLDEGFQNPKFEMPRMPEGCQLENLRAFLVIEGKIRDGSIIDASQVEGLPNYWKDLSLVLLRYADNKFGRGQEVIEKNFANISHGFYDTFFTGKPKLVTTNN